MIQQTTLAMIVKTIDQSTAPLTAIQNKVATVGRTTENSTRVLGGLARASARVTSAMGNSGLSRVLGSVNTLLGIGGFVGIAGLASVAVVGLVDKIKTAVQEHKRLKEAADRLDLPIRQLKEYSDEWLKVAIRINDATRGFTEFTDAQSKGFQTLGINRFEPGAIDKARTRVAAASGSRQSKIEVLRILTGSTPEEAARELDAELKRLNEVVANNRRGGLVRRFEREGVVMGAENVDQLRRTGAIATDLELRNRAEGRRELEAVQRARIEGAEIASKEIAEIDEAEYRRRRGLAQEEARVLREIEEGLQDDIANALEAGDRRIQEALESTLDGLSSIGDEIRIMRGPTEILHGARMAVEDYERSISDVAARTEEMTTGWLYGFEDAVVEVVRTGKLSFSDLAQSIILDLARIQARAAAVNLGNLLFGSAGGGGGWLGGLLGGNAGGGTASGVRIVGEEGKPEVVAGGINTFKVYNERQMAFAAGGGGRQPITLHYSPVYHLSGVETRDVIAYIERGREQDQKGMLAMLERNFGVRMR